MLCTPSPLRILANGGDGVACEVGGALGVGRDGGNLAAGVFEVEVGCCAPATIAELAGGKLPEGVTMDSVSFAPQLKGEAGTPREWVFVQLVDEWYVRSPRWKLTQAGELFDMKDAPFEEIAVPADTQDPEAIAGRKQLQAALDELKPTASKQGDHAVGGRKPARNGKAQ